MRDTDAQRFEAALTGVVQALSGLRLSLLEGDAERVDGSVSRLHTALTRMRTQAGAHAASHASDPRLQAAMEAARNTAQSNAALAQQRAQLTCARLDHLAADAPGLEQRRLTTTYAPAGAISAGAPRPRGLGRA